MWGALAIFASSPTYLSGDKLPMLFSWFPFNEFSRRLTFAWARSGNVFSSKNTENGNNERIGHFLISRSRMSSSAASLYLAAAGRLRGACERNASDSDCWLSAVSQRRPGACGGGHCTGRGRIREGAVRTARGPAAAARRPTCRRAARRLKAAPITGPGAALTDETWKAGNPAAPLKTRRQSDASREPHI